MAHETVESVVAALLAAYEGALEHHARWRRRAWQDNHYRGRDGRPRAAHGGCALSTSLRYAVARIRDTFDNGVDVLGPDFAAGDEPCRQALLANLARLQARVDALQRAAADGAPLELLETVRTSEAVRAASLRALAEQYHRVAVGRLSAPRRAHEPTPKPAPAPATAPATAPQPRSSPPASADPPESDAEPVRSSSSPPPSPPPTPKPAPDDARSTGTAETGPPRPRASVFSLFCPAALEYQVDLTRALPAGAPTCRRCGYRWHPGPGVALKDGFRLTPRFLGKSHCRAGFACVLCTSSGDTAVYGSAAALADHINLSHDKWQMLHERDLSGR